MSEAGTAMFEDAEGLADRTLVALSKIGLALRSEAWKETTPRGLNPTQAQVLVVLKRAGAGLRLSDIADRLGVSAPTVSVSVSTLERKGLVRKERAAEDARALAVSLTPSGRAEAGRMAAWPDLLLDAVGVLDEAEEAVFLKALLKVIRELQEQGRISPARMCITCHYFRPDVHDDEERPHHCAFVDAPFGERNLRVDCGDHEQAAPTAAGLSG